MKRLLVFLLLACPLIAQKAEHEPGETLQHFYIAEGVKNHCYAESLKYALPGECAVTLDDGASYVFREGALYSIETYLRGSFDEVVAVISKRYGPPTGRAHIVRLYDGELATEHAYWQRQGFTVDLLWLKGVNDGNSFEHAFVMSRMDKKPGKPNRNF